MHQEDDRIIFWQNHWKILHIQPGMAVDEREDLRMDRDCPIPILNDSFMKFFRA
jgi:hypothetical protein